MFSVPNFNIFAESHCAEINIYMDADPLPPDRKEDARRFGMKVESPPRPITAETFMYACLKKLIGQVRSSDQKKFLTDEQGTKWTKMISYLEGTDRKLLNVDKDQEKLTLTLFCPSQLSAQELKQPAWISKWEQELAALTKALGKLKSFNSKLVLILSSK